jgi:hypothetical protein
VRTIHLPEVRKPPIPDKSGESLGRLAGVIVRRRGPELPLVIRRRPCSSP